MPLQPAQYTGVDLLPGPGVDVVCPAERLLDHFAPESFDVVVSTEVIEHVRDWRRVAHNLKNLLREDGILICTTRSRGFEFHGYPLDFWRFEPEDISEIFGDLEVETIERDIDDPPGVFFQRGAPRVYRTRLGCLFPLLGGKASPGEIANAIRRRRRNAASPQARPP